MDIENAIESLLQIKEILDRHEVEFWLIDGTLLGAIREGGLIQWDRDVDLGTWYENQTKIASLYYEFLEKGFMLNFTGEEINIHNIKKDIYFGGIDLFHLDDKKAIRYSTGNPREFCLLNGKPCRIKSQYYFRVLIKHIIWLLKDNDINFDFPKVRLKKTINLIPSKLRIKLISLIRITSEKLGIKFRKLVFPSNYFKKLKPLLLYKKEFMVPVESEKYLESRYGKNWRIPKKDFKPYGNDDFYPKGENL